MNTSDKRVEAHAGMDHPLYTGPEAGELIETASSDVGRGHPLATAVDASDQGGTVGSAFGSDGSAEGASDQGNTLALPDLKLQPALDAYMQSYRDEASSWTNLSNLEHAFEAGFRAGVQSCSSK